MEDIAAKRKGLRSRWPRRRARRLRSRAQERGIASDVHPRRSCCKKAEHENGLITRTLPASSSLLEAQTAARRVFTRKRGIAGLGQSLQRWITRPAKEAIGLTEVAPPQRRGTTEAA